MRRYISNQMLALIAIYFCILSFFCFANKNWPA